MSLLTITEIDYYSFVQIDCVYISDDVIKGTKKRSNVLNLIILLDVYGIEFLIEHVYYTIWIKPLAIDLNLSKNVYLKKKIFENEASLTLNSPDINQRDQ